MATATPNILINSIRGRIGNVVFYTRYGRQCVRIHVIPRNPDTEAQRAVRRAFGDAVRSWQAMSTDEKYTYTRKARHLNMSGYNLYISNYLKRIMQTLVLISTDESKSKLSSLPWNMELSTWNSLPLPERFPSVSKSYMLPSGFILHGTPLQSDP
jgi:hypothetical protein